MVTTRSADARQAAAASGKHAATQERTGQSPDPKRAKAATPKEKKQDKVKEVSSKSNHDQVGAKGGETKQASPRDAGSHSQDANVPSNVLEKGIIYFFIRGRVEIDEPRNVNEIARTYMILRPIPKDASLGDGPVHDAATCRLFAVPKKVLPTSGRERLMAFIEKPDASVHELKETFLPGDEHETKTVGTRHTPAATPVAEGVYALTTTGRESHLAYILTLPAEIGDVAKALGLRKRGSFIISTKNPEYPGPAEARLPKGPDFPKKITEEFRSLRWLPSNPEHLDYANTQVLLVGESSGIGKATEPQDGDKGANVKEPLDVIEELEDEDTVRMKHLSGDASVAVFRDLEVRARGYPKLQTSF